MAKKENKVDYQVRIGYTSRPLTTKERIKIKDISITIPLDAESQEREVIFKPDLVAELLVHNEKSENVDYEVYIVIDESGTTYSTSSKSFYRQLSDILDEIKDAEDEAGEFEDWAIKVIRKDSKNYKGKSFLTCTII